MAVFEWNIMVYYIIAMAIPVLILAGVMKGFLLPFLKVRLSFGKLIFVRLRAKNRDYFKAGWIEGGQLYYHNKKEGKKIKEKLTLPEGHCTYRFLNVDAIDVDEETAAILMPSFAVEQGYNPIKIDNYLERIIKAPKEGDKLIITILILAIIAAVGACAAAYFGFTTQDQIEILKGMVGQTIENTKIIPPKVIP